VELVAFGGKRLIFGINNLTNGSTENEKIKTDALKNLSAKKFKTKSS
jgi:hypothetical protein